VPTYKISFETGAGTMIEVTAKDEDAAIDKAYNKLPSICAQCSGWGQHAGIDLGDWELAQWDGAIEVVSE
jgi:hypothetical protein